MAADVLRPLQRDAEVDQPPLEAFEQLPGRAQPRELLGTATDVISDGLLARPRD